jgi:hypothetical protein
MKYTTTNYATQCSYLCNTVHCVKKTSFLLHVHKFKMSIMWVERKMD